MQRRALMKGSASLTMIAALGSHSNPAAAESAPHQPASTPFDASTVRRIAQELSRKPYQPPETNLPTVVSKLSWDQWRSIRFQKDRALWRNDNLPFRVELIHRGYLFEQKVEINEVSDGQSRPVAFNPDLFEYEDQKLRVTGNLGFAGFRIHAPINRPDYYDECVVFLGASYFRAVAKGQVYGLSARGLAIGTGNPKGEEFAAFRTFWLEKPRPDSHSIVVHALLDTRSTTGAYRFTIHPGDTTVFDVESTLYPRVDITEPGLATMTSMFDFDFDDREGVDDWRPAAHDSEGLSIWVGNGDQIWRPLVNPRDLQFSAFADGNTRGFGLMQRKRAFADYQDLALRYEKRPSLWIETIGDWGQGSIDLVEIPTPNEVNDNIVSFWRPKEKLAAKGEYNFTYRMHWGWDTPWPTKLARVADTRSGLADDKQGREYVIDFTGDAVKSLTTAQPPNVEVHASAGQIRNIFSEPNPDIGGWRIGFELVPGGEKLVEVTARLSKDNQPLTESWMFRWTP